MPEPVTPPAAPDENRAPDTLVAPTPAANEPATEAGSAPETAPAANDRWMPPPPVQLPGGATGGTGQPIPPATPRFGADPSELPPTHPEWKMSSAGPLPERPRRRWLFWLLIVIGVFLLICVLLFVWSATLGRGFIDGLATQVSVEATRQAGGATPVATP